MEIIQSLLNLTLFPLMLLSTCFVLPSYWVFRILSFLVRSLLSEDVKDKVILITGASSGIGEHVAYEYAKRGARLALAARREDRLLAVAEKARELGSPNTLIISADVSIAENCEQMVQKTINHFGRVDHLVNNAGIVSSNHFEEFSDIQEMKSIMDVNFWGAVYTTRSAMPHLRTSKGKIVVVASSAAWIPGPMLTIYCASKSALRNFFEALRAEVGSDVKITVVTPGCIHTEMTTIRKNMTENDAAKATNEFWVKFFERKKNIPIAKVEGCAKAIVRSACRGDKYLTEPKWMLAAHWATLLYPELSEAIVKLIEKY